MYDSVCHLWQGTRVTLSVIELTLSYSQMRSKPLINPLTHWGNTYLQTPVQLQGSSTLASLKTRCSTHWDCFPHKHSSDLEQTYTSLSCYEEASSPQWHLDARVTHVEGFTTHTLCVLNGKLHSLLPLSAHRASRLASVSKVMLLMLVKPSVDLMQQHGSILHVLSPSDGTSSWKLKCWVHVLRNMASKDILYDHVHILRSAPTPCRAWWLPSLTQACDQQWSQHK